MRMLMEGRVPSPVTSLKEHGSDIKPPQNNKVIKEGTRGEQGRVMLSILPVPLQAS